MIDLEYVKTKFELYSENNFKLYTQDHTKKARIKLKYNHMKRVMENSINIAKQLNLSEKDIKLAGVIGLLHDIGRFEQIKQFNTFVDKDSVNHAMFSSYQLFDNGLIRFFIIDDSYDEIIKKAIENHSRFEIEKDLSEEEQLHAKIIRDADKIDIYKQVLSSDASLVFDGPMPTQESLASPLVLESFYKNQCIKNDDMQTKIDDFIRKCGMIFGFYFPDISLKIIYDYNYISKLKKHFLNNFNISEKAYEQINEVEKKANEYLQKNRKR